jgi:hypothetical protein
MLKTNKHPVKSGMPPLEFPNIRKVNEFFLITRKNIFSWKLKGFVKTVYPIFAKPNPCIRLRAKFIFAK